MYLWPGLPQVWKRGAWTALAFAFAFTLLVNAALVASFLWTDLLPPEVRKIGWVAVGALWAGSAVYSRFWDPSDRTTVHRPETANPDPYPGALEHYLRGNWFEAECVLGELLRQNPRDLDAGLLLASLLRHTGRFDEAARQLDRLEKFEGIGKWALEICRERQYLHEARQTQTSQPVGSPNGE